MVHPFVVKKYIDINGACPFDNWLENLKNKQDVNRINYRIRRLESDGSCGVIESVGSGVYELKFYFGPGYRVYVGFESNKMILLLVGGKKATQKKDIKKAKDYLKDYLESKDDTNKKFL